MRLTPLRTATGTPPRGSMRTPPRYLHEGAELVTEISGLGVQRNTARTGTAVPA